MNPLRILTALSFVLGCCTACQDPKNSEEYQSLAAAHASLQDSMQRMQQEVNDITLSMNQIEKNLVKLRRDEMQIDDIRDEATPKRLQGDRIFLILAEMDAYMEENKTLIGKLDKQLAKSRQRGAATTGSPAKTGHSGKGGPDRGTHPVDGQDEGGI